MKSSRVFFCFIFLVLCNYCCANQPTYTKGKLIKGTIDGCSWLIQLPNKKILQPTNINKFNLKLKNGKRIKFTYKTLKNVAGFCMMGDMVELLEIKK